MTLPNPAERIRSVRDFIRNETAKLPPVDHNGHTLPVDEPPADDDGAAILEPVEPADGAATVPAAEPQRRNPVADPSQGGAVTPTVTPSREQQMADAKARGDVREQLRLINSAAGQPRRFPGMPPYAA
ncbi:hypothetical protein O7635_27860 [Asanoa sp. WMMD1127]|uniref:hypothetical protein n=1 Tax=Asanoa sp. WMMD1127 TaxID=3016107 RepID=UPI0024164FC4|nr:hypothetical protein [Asanoa sp. WMMD1127]MDG4825679.1 hypothetical protein [Asanoa sp. WMMD1127]